MAVTNKQGRSKEAMSEADRAHKANEDVVNKSVDEWRAMQGLPPIDRSEKARHPEDDDGEDA